MRTTTLVKPLSSVLCLLCVHTPIGVSLSPLFPPVSPQRLWMLLLLLLLLLLHAVSSAHPSRVVLLLPPHQDDDLHIPRWQPAAQRPTQGPQPAPFLIPLQHGLCLTSRLRVR